MMKDPANRVLLLKMKRLAVVVQVRMELKMLLNRVKTKLYQPL
jgi:hypothetical protein